MFEKLLPCMTLCVTGVHSDSMLCVYGLPEGGHTQGPGDSTRRFCICTWIVNCQQLASH